MPAKKPKTPDPTQPAISYAERSMSSYVFSATMPGATAVAGEVTTERGSRKPWTARVSEEVSRGTTVELTATAPTRDGAVRALLARAAGFAS